MSVYALDHRGHGRSGGKRGHVESFMDYVYDLKLFIDLIREENRSSTASFSWVTAWAERSPAGMHSPIPMTFTASFYHRPA